MEQLIHINRIPKKQKRRFSIWRRLIKRFEPEREYTEKEVNQMLRELYEDYVTLRRYLIEDGFLERRPDGSCYWVKPVPVNRHHRSSEV